MSALLAQEDFECFLARLLEGAMSAHLAAAALMGEFEEALTKSEENGSS